MNIFAYGSNMNQMRLQKRVSSAIKVCNAYIIGYKLQCNKVSTDGSTKGNIVFTNNSEDVVWGVIFEINNNQKPDLDRVEGLGNGYNETTLEFLNSNIVRIAAQVYIADEGSVNNNLLPYDWYKEYILTGAIENQLPQEYIQKIQLMDYVVDEDNERRRRHFYVINRNQ